MRMRCFGPAAERLSILGLGCSRIGSLSNPTPSAEIRRTLSHALDLGINVFDTADVYGQGDSERELGRALRGRRNSAFVVTKVGTLLSRRVRLLRPFKPLIKPFLSVSGEVRQSVGTQHSNEMTGDFTPGRLGAALDASLRRLGFSHVDGLLLHCPPATLVGDPRLAAALAALQAGGKVRHFGVSCDDIASLRAAIAMPGLTLLQLSIDIIDAIAATELPAQIAERRVAVFAREVIKRQPALSPEAAVAASDARPGVTCTVVGVSSRRHLSELARGFAEPATGVDVVPYAAAPTHWPFAARNEGRL